MKLSRFAWLAVFSLLLSARAATGTEEVVYVANSYWTGDETWSTIAMLRGKSLAPLNTIQLLRRAYGVAVTPDGERVWVTQSFANRITVIDAADFTVLTNIDLGDVIDYQPKDVVIDPDGLLAYVAYSITGEVSVWNAHTGFYVDTIDVGGEVTDLRISPDGDTLWASDGVGSRITMIRTSDRTIVDTVDLGIGLPNDIAVSPDGSRLYVAESIISQIDVMRTSDREFLTSIDTAYVPNSLAVSADGDHLFVGYQPFSGGAFDMIRVADGAVVASLPTVFATRTAVRPDGSRVFVTNVLSDKCVAVDVDGESLTLAQEQNLDTIPGYLARPFGVAIGAYRSPVPTATINGMEGPVHLTRADTARLTLTLDAGGRTDDADWWLGAIAPTGRFFWTPAGWSTTRLPLYQGPLFDVPNFSSGDVPLATWPLGKYVFGFAIDVRRDGLISNRYAYVDRVTMILEE